MKQVKKVKLSWRLCFQAVAQKDPSACFQRPVALWHASQGAVPYMAHESLVNWLIGSAANASFRLRDEWPMPYI